MDHRTPARRLLVLLLAGSVLTGPAFAGPPPWADGGR